jgi:hypothetical protein
MSQHTAWKKLLIQAFNDTPISTTTGPSCGLFSIHRYISHSLRQSGIENGSPFSWLQLIKILLQSGGAPDEIRYLCVSLVQDMRKPAYGFMPGYTGELVGLSLILLLLLTPQIATTSKSLANASSILIDYSLVIEDVDQHVNTLPLSSDYPGSPYSIPESTSSKPTVIASGPHTSEWIKQQPDSAYSLQLLTVSKPENLINFCKQHDICEQSAYYQTEINGKRLTRLLYGVYADLQAVKQAKLKLPPALKQVNPWARRFKTIKSEI